jgi:tRNA (guanine9-N1)-methyltransferase
MESKYEQGLDSNRDCGVTSNNATDNFEESKGEPSTLSGNGSESGMSKNQRKRLLKSQHWEEKKKMKKEREKALKQEKRLAQGKSVEDHNPQTVQNEEVAKLRRENKEETKLQFLQKCNSNFNVIIDCSWENDHTEKALKSLKQQIIYCYGFNKRCENPCNIYVTGVGTRMKELLAKNDIDRFLAFHVSPNPYSEVVSGKELVYLTSDGEELLETLDPSCSYIIGGIVDRNRLKRVTYLKAKEQGIRTARLPIKEHCTMAATSVLTVNHVFEILVKFEETKSWVKAFQSVLPARKAAEIANDEDDNANSDTDGQI